MRNYSLFSYYCAGILAANFIQLRWRNVSSEVRLTYSMNKNSKNVPFHISRHSFAKVAKETGLNSDIVKELLAHSNLATTRRYMGNFDTQKTGNALINLFRRH